MPRLVISQIREFYWQENSHVTKPLLMSVVFPYSDLPLETLKIRFILITKSKGHQFEILISLLHLSYLPREI